MPTLQGKIDEAEDLYNKCLEIDLKVYGPDSTQAATSYNNLANLCRQQVNVRVALSPCGPSTPTRGCGARDSAQGSV